MKQKYPKKTNIKKRQKKLKRMLLLCIVLFCLCLGALITRIAVRIIDNNAVREQQESIKKSPETEYLVKEEKQLEKPALEEVPEIPYKIEILKEYESAYNQNKDMIGWLKIEDTKIDYPVMQTLEDENIYLDKGFDKAKNVNGSLILDTDSVAGVGIKENNYISGSKPSTNLIIHGHTMKSGLMFGNLPLYENEEYGKKHSIIKFDSLYEKREYELISVFYTQVYYETDDVFKYYKFFQANTKEEFDDWYQNIKKMSIYDTGVTAEFGDEFITLSCCSYQVEDGRFVVVGKRI